MKFRVDETSDFIISQIVGFLYGIFAEKHCFFHLIAKIQRFPLKNRMIFLGG